MAHPVKFGNNTRMSYSKLDEVVDIPPLLEVQHSSYEWFFEKGLPEILESISPITDFSGDIELYFVDFEFDREHPKHTEAEARERDANYAAPLRVKVRLLNKKTNTVNEQMVFIGDIPVMTDNGTFIINGAERVIISQMVRSPGAYYSQEVDKKSGKVLHSAQIIPNRGAWLEYDVNSRDVINVRVDRARKFPLTVFLRALGFGTNDEIIRTSVMTIASWQRSLKTPRAIWKKVSKSFIGNFVQENRSPQRVQKHCSIICFLIPIAMI